MKNTFDLMPNLVQIIKGTVEGALIWTKMFDTSAILYFFIKTTAGLYRGPQRRCLFTVERPGI